MKRLLTILSMLSVFVLPGLLTLPAVAATPTQQVCAGVGLASGGGCGDKGVQLSTVLSSVINLLLIAVGVIAVVMIIIAGLSFVTSGGDASKVTAAKNSIVHAVIGLIIVAFAEVLVHFVIGTAKG